MSEARNSWIPAPGSPVRLIAELANAHEGRVDYAERMIDAAAEAGADTVKFQKYLPEEMLAAGHPQMDLFRRLCWPDEAWRTLVRRAKGKGLFVFIDVFGVQAFDFAAGIEGVDGFKVHAADLANEPLLDRLAQDPRPVLFGTAASADLDVFRALERVGRPERIVLMHGFQGFPTPLADTALIRLTHLKETFGTAVGLSEHIDAEDPLAKIAPLMALPLGVAVVEKHLTLDRSAKGVDYQSSLNPGEWKDLAAAVRRAEVLVGKTGLPASSVEEGYRKRFKKSLTALRPIKAGQPMNGDAAAYRMTQSPERHTLSLSETAGRKAARDIPAGAVLSHADIGSTAGLCVIARLKSTRLPRKAFVDLHGKTAIERVLERSKLCSVERVVLATSDAPSDAELLEAARKNGVEGYAGDAEEPLERMLALADKHGWSFVVRVTGDTVLLDPGLLNRAVDLARAQNLDYVSMWTAPIGTHCEVVSTAALRALRRHARAEFTSEYLSWFLYANPNFKSADLELPAGERRDWRLTLDTPEDLDCIRRALALVGPNLPDYTLAELVRAVEGDAALVEKISAEPYRPAPPAGLRFDFRAVRTPS